VGVWHRRFNKALLDENGGFVEQKKIFGARMKFKTTFILIVLVLSVGCTYRKGRISLQSDPPGAEVYIGGTKIGETPVTFDYVCCFFEELEIVKDGYEPSRELLSKLWIKEEARRGRYGETMLVMDGKARKAWTVTTRRVLRKKGEVPGYAPETASEGETPATRKVSVKYDPATTMMIDKSLGENITVGILDIPDRRHDAEGKEYMIGTVYPSLRPSAAPLTISFKNRFKRIYSEQPINLDAMDALTTLFSANGFEVKKYPEGTECDDLSDERLCVKGQINQFWTERFYHVGAVVEIDIEVWDRKYGKAIWSGKIADFQKKHKAYLASSLDETDRMILFLNSVLSEAINTAWTLQGMREALEKWKTEEKTENQSHHYLPLHPGSQS
jgi:hypothetical protein